MVNVIEKEDVDKVIYNRYGVLNDYSNSFKEFNIDKDIEYFKQIESKIYSITDFDASIYDLYHNSTKLNLLDMNESNFFKLLSL